MRATIGTLVLLATLLTGCGGGQPQSPSSQRPVPAAPQLSPILQEKIPAYRLSLPRPGASLALDLDERSAEDREKALVAAREGRWHEAVTGFADARRWAYCSPSLLYNLAVAYQGKGDIASAGLYYRVYLTMEPQAPDAGEVRTQIARIRQQLVELSERFQARADVLVKALDATPPRGGGMSLRAGAYQTMMNYAYLVDDVPRGDNLLANLRALPGMGDRPEPPARQNHGSLINMYRRDLPAVGRTQSAKISSARIHAIEGDGEAALRSLGSQVNLRDVFLEDLLDDLRRARAWDAVALIDHEKLNQLKGWDYLAFGKLAGDMDAMFWGGRPDLARRLALSLRDYFKKNDEGHERVRGPYFYVLAVLYDLEGLEKEFRDYQQEPETFRYYPINETSVILAAVAPEAEKKRILSLLDRTLDLTYAARTKYTESIGLGALSREFMYPDTLRVRSHLALGPFMFDEPELELPPDIRFMRYLVAVGDRDGAIQIAPKLPIKDALVELQRLAIARSDEHAAQEADTYADTACQGWRPRDLAQAKAVWTALSIADQYAIPPADDIDPQKELDELAKQKPEEVPAQTASHAANFRLMSALIGE